MRKTTSPILRLSRSFFERVLHGEGSTLSIGMACTDRNVVEVAKKWSPDAIVKQDEDEGQGPLSSGGEN